MKRWKKIVIRLFVVILMTVTGLAVWQRDNLKVVYTFLTSDPERISQSIEEKRETLEQDHNIVVQAPTADLNSDLLEGKVTPEEAKAELGLPPKPEDSEPKSEETSSKSDAPKQEKLPETPKVEEPETEEFPQLTEDERRAQTEALVNACVAELYACEVDLMAQMGEMKKLALSDWNYRKPKDKTRDKMIEFGFSWLEEVYKVEVEADRTVKGILETYREPLEELDADTSVLDDMWMYYCDKKTNTKAYYLDKYLN